MPVTRIKRRYIAFKVLEPPAFSKPELRNSMAQALSEFRNMSFVQPSDFRIIEYDPLTRMGIIRCGHLRVDALRTMFKSMKLRETFVKVEVVTVSGTLKALRSRLRKSQT
jgi:RNase P/RNase MRP subunit POP5